MFRILGLCLVLSVATGCENSSYQIDMQNRLALAGQALSLDFLYNYVSKNNTVSYVTSVPPLLSALGEMATRSEGDTKTQLLDLLNLKDKDEVKQAFKTQFYRLLKAGGKRAEYFGRVYANDDEPFCKKFTNVVNSFGESTDTVDYDDPEQAADDINKDIVKQGKNGFDELVSASDIDQNGGLIFVTTFELIATFNHKLDTTQPPFILFNGGYGRFKLVPALTLKDSNIKYAKVDDYEVIEVEIEGIDLSIVIFFPSKPEELLNMLSKLRSPKTFNAAIDQLEETCLQLTFPAISGRFKADLGESLQEVRNISQIYTPGEPDFKGIQKKCSTYISATLHESSIGADPKRPALKESKTGECSSYKKVILKHAKAFFIVDRSEKLLPSLVLSIVEL